jgi:hypothetical protein
VPHKKKMLYNRIKEEDYVTEGATGSSRNCNYPLPNPCATSLLHIFIFVLCFNREPCFANPVIGLRSRFNCFSEQRMAVGLG